MPSEAFTTTGATTWTVPAGVTLATLECYGGGGSGLGLGLSPGGTGGEGGYYSRAAVPVTPAEVLDVTVGRGGLAAIGGSRDGLASSVSRSGTPLCRAPGGRAGTALGGGTGGNGAAVGDVTNTGGAGGSNPLARQSGASGGGAGGTTGAGTAGTDSPASGFAAGGAGGGGLAGAGGRGGEFGGAQPAGSDGSTRGGGGGGAADGEFTAGNGGAGAVVVTWAVYVPGTWARVDADDRVRRIDADPGLPP